MNGVLPDVLLARLEFFSQSCQLTVYEGDRTSVAIVSPSDVAAVMLRHISVATGLLPPETLWWTNTNEGPLYALYRPPRVWKVALQLTASEPPKRMELPMPAFVFLCIPGKAPYVYAMKGKPKGLKTPIYEAPLYNVFKNGFTCAGSNKYPMRVTEIPESFFLSFFTKAGDAQGRCKSEPEDLLRLWMSIEGKPKFPAEELVRRGILGDLPGLGVVNARALGARTEEYGDAWDDDDE